MRFLRRAGNYNLQEALSICEKKQLHRETVFLLGRNYWKSFRKQLNL